MGWWSDAWDWVDDNFDWIGDAVEGVGDFLDDNSSWLSPVVEGGSQLLGAHLSVEANKRAEKIMREAVERAIEARRAGNEKAAQEYEKAAAQAISTLTGASAQAAEHVIQRSGQAIEARRAGNEAAAREYEQAAAQAMSTLRDSSAKASGHITQSSEQALAARREGNERATARFDPIVQAGDMSRDKLLEIAMSDPGSLTPGQTIMLNDLARHGDATAAAGGLRGAGRARMAMMDDLEGRAMARFFDSNRARSDAAIRDAPTHGIEARGAQAALDADTGRAGFDANLWAGSNLAGIEGRLGENLGGIEMGVGERKSELEADTGKAGYDANLWAGSNLADIEGNKGRNIANIEMGVGQRTSDLAHDTGVAEYGGEILTGQAGAGRRIADGNIYSSTVGAVGGVIAEEMRDKERKSRFAGAPYMEPV